MERNVIINDKTILVKEVKYREFAKIQSVEKEDAPKKLLQLSTGLTDEEFDNLSLKDGIKLMQAVNEVNGLVESENFQAK